MPEARKYFAFDAFGTLFDVHSAARAAAPLIGEHWPRVSEIWRAKQLEYTWIHAGLGRHIPFREATRQGLLYALAVCGCDERQAPRILDEYTRLATYPEVAEVLSGLKAHGARLAVLSNGDPDMLDALARHAGLRDIFEALISVSAAGTFKPAPAVYKLCTDQFGVGPALVTFLSSNRWDIAGAAAFGFRAVWVNRSGAPDEYPHLAADRTIADLRPLLYFD